MPSQMGLASCFPLRAVSIFEIWMFSFFIRSSSVNSRYIGTSRARAIFSKVSTEGTVCPFSTREM
jgi:hypothetical protein